MFIDQSASHASYCELFWVFCVYPACSLTNRNIGCFWFCVIWTRACPSCFRLRWTKRRSLPSARIVELKAGYNGFETDKKKSPDLFAFFTASESAFLYMGLGSLQSLFSLYFVKGDFKVTEIREHHYLFGLGVHFPRLLRACWCVWRSIARISPKRIIYT